jgi:cyclic-di-GMP-binding protein
LRRLTKGAINAGVEPVYVGANSYNDSAFNSSSRDLSVRDGRRAFYLAHLVGALNLWRKPMPSFDVVSELDKHEVTNAVDNACKELERRFDLRGKGSFELKELVIHLTGEADFIIEQMKPILEQSLIKRKIDVQCLEYKDAFPSGKGMKQEATLREGIDKELAKKIVAHVKDSKLKVQAAIQGEQVRITGKKRDDLQEAMAVLRAKDFSMPLQFNNFRD